LEIKSDIQDQKAYLRKLNNELKRKIELKENELKKTDQYYEDRKAIEQDEGKEKVELQRMRYNDLLMADSERSQAALEEANENIQKQIKVMEEGLNKYRVKNEDTFLEEKNIHDEKLAKSKSRFERTSEDISHRGRLDLSQIQTQTNLQLSSKREDAKHAINTLERDNEHKLSSKQKLYENKISNIELEQLKSKNQLKNSHIDEMNKLQTKFVVDQETIKTNNVSQLSKQEENQKLLIKNKGDVFREKYNKINEQHKQALKLIQERNRKEIEGIKKSFESNKSYIENIAQDSFYRNTKLNPEVKELEGHYEVSLQVPAHEKELVDLSGDKRKIKVSVTRRFQDRTEDKDTNTVNRTSRSESFQKEFNVKDIVDSSKIVSRYQDGKLTFIIPKM